MYIAIVMMAAMAAEVEPRDEVLVVTATREERPLRELAGNTTRIGDDALDLAGHTHASEIMVQVPGAWVTRGSTQEHLTAIRSPILTGPGACGAFLFMEDGLPVRPAGFCNINQLVELNTEMARAIEVVRGPGSALYGSNALHGMINVITRGPHDGDARSRGAELGPNGFFRARGSVASVGSDTAWRLGGVYARDDGWRDGSGHDQYKVNARIDGGDLEWSVAVTGLRQDTAAFIVGEDAYRDRAVARSNPSPDAFRDMDSQRVSVRWSGVAGGWDLTVRPYARRSGMSFLQHFIPGQPLEDNGHHSIGSQVTLRRIGDGGATWLLGADLEYADIFIRQAQVEPLTDASPFLNATRPQGRHYDFEVDAVTAAAYAHGEFRFADAWRSSAGLRIEHTRYDYENRMDDGNLRDDGTPCDLGGCHYNRPADRRDGFTVVTPKLGLARTVGERSDAYLSLTRGHRAPQVHELYRLQRGQDVADLSPERIDSAEVGMRGFAGTLQYDAALFGMRKRSIVFNDSDGFAVSGGRTRHRGLEAMLARPLADDWILSLGGTLARHTWDFDHDIAGGETITSGDDIDSAPRRLGSARLAWLPGAGQRVELEWVYVGAYWLDTENTRRYPGHDLLNLRGRHDIRGGWQVAWRLTNLTDRRYAERADFAFGDFRYFPGPPRQLYLGVTYRAF